jgi:CheY-like chemotaxis protein
MRKVKHFLVIDDDPTARFIAGDAIEEAGLAEKIIYCHDGKEAISYVKENCFPTTKDPNRQCPELILLYINMPVMDGYEFLEELASIEDLKHNNTSVILASSAAYPKEESKIEKFSILGYIEKPVKPEKLVELVSDKYKPLQ